MLRSTQSMAGKVGPESIRTCSATTETHRQCECGSTLGPVDRRPMRGGDASPRIMTCWTVPADEAQLSSMAAKAATATTAEDAAQEDVFGLKRRAGSRAFVQTRSANACKDETLVRCLQTVFLNQMISFAIRSCASEGRHGQLIDHVRHIPCHKGQCSPSLQGLTCRWSPLLPIQHCRDVDHERLVMTIIANSSA